MFSVLLTESIVAGMSLILKHQIDYDFLLAGLVASLAVASLVGAAIVYFQDKISERKAQAEALQKEYDFFTKLTSQVPGIVSQFQIFPDGHSCFPYASSAIEDICELTPDDVKQSASPLFSRIHPEDHPGVMDSINESARTLLPWHYEFRVVLPSKGTRWLLGNALPEKAEDGSILWHGFITDITEHKNRESLLKQSEARFRSLFENVEKIPVQGYDRDHRVIFWNKASENLYGFSSEEAVGRRLEDLIVPPEMRGAVMKSIDEWIQNGVPAPAKELVLQTKSGNPVSVFSSHTMLANSFGDMEMYCIDIDMTERKKADEVIWRQANFDPLTGLPNRRMLHDRLEHDLKKAHRSNLKLALMFLDLDRFKEVNDTLGHDMGDALLRDASRRIVSCVRETDTVARLGGDEFTVILDELHNPGDVERVTQDILAKLATPFDLGNEVAYVSASIGVTLYPDDAAEIEDLFKNADQAMYAAKHQGRNRCCYFTPSMQEAAQVRRRIAKDLHLALANQEFWLDYQPIIDLASGSIHKAEALLRWRHPDHGIINPETFIPVAEETGLIVDIGDWVFRESARQVARLRARHNPAFQISINKSPAQFHNTRCVHAAWFEYLEEIGLPGESILVEITEGLLLDIDDGVSEKLLAMSEMGMQVSLDDFGTGYSSLSYLKKLDIDYLKIDQSFVHNLSKTSDEMALCEAIIVMAHKLGIKVIAEGVETPQQRDLLIAAYCDYGQGYLFSRPLPAEEFENLLEEWGHRYPQD